MTLGRWVGVPAAIFFAAGTFMWRSVPAMSAPSFAERTNVPALHSVNAQQTLMTAVTRAGERLVSVGDRGTILLSDDHGGHWRQAKVVPASVTLTNVAFVSPRVGWAVGHGGIVLRSADGGETWSKQLDGIRAAQIELDAATQAAAAAPTERSTARRLREAQRLTAAGPDKPFLDLHFFDDSHGVVIGAYGLAFVTHDGGITWRSLIGGIDNPGGRHLVDFLKAESGLYIAGEQGLVLRSADGGETFATIETPSRGTFFGILDASDGAILAFGLRGAIYRTTDAGASWQKIDVPEVSINGGTRLEDGELVLVDELGNVLLSHDDGLSFASLPVPQATSLVAVTQATDGGLILAGVRGNVRMALKDKNDKPGEETRR